MIVKAKYIQNPKGGRSATSYHQAKAITSFNTEDFTISGRTFHIVFSCSENETPKIHPEEMLKVVRRTLDEYRTKTKNFFQYSVSIHKDNGLLHAHVTTSGLWQIPKSDLNFLKQMSQQYLNGYMKTLKPFNFQNYLNSISSLLSYREPRIAMNTANQMNIERIQSPKIKGKH